MTQKDRDRVAALIEHTQRHGITSGSTLAAEQAQVITKPEKCAARAQLLAEAGFAALAAPFTHRHAWLTS